MLRTLNYFVAKLTFGQLYGEFNLAVSKKQFSYEAKRNNLALNGVQKSAKSLAPEWFADLGIGWGGKQHENL